MYLVKDYSVDIHIATVIRGISFLLIDSNIPKNFVSW